MPPRLCELLSLSLSLCVPNPVLACTSATLGRQVGRRVRAVAVSRVVPDRTHGGRMGAAVGAARVTAAPRQTRLRILTVGIGLAAPLFAFLGLFRWAPWRNASDVCVICCSFYVVVISWQRGRCWDCYCSLVEIRVQRV